ncbi:Uncharacterised protein [Vibrio cholerae]|nr:Uncharacterised protein [Vibrio cholerae]
MWFTAAEALKQLHRLFAATHLKDVVEEALASLTVENAFFFKA